MRKNRKACRLNESPGKPEMRVSNLATPLYIQAAIKTSRRSSGVKIEWFSDLNAFAAGLKSYIMRKILFKTDTPERRGNIAGSVLVR